MRINLECVWHVLSFGLALCWTVVTSAVGGAVLSAMFPTCQSFAELMMVWLDISSACLFAPFIIAIVNNPPKLRWIREFPRRTFFFCFLVFLVALLPVVMAVAVKRYAIAPTILGMFLTLPLIAVAAPLTGLRGVTFCTCVVGIVSIILIPFAQNMKSLVSQLTPRQVHTDHVFLTQICIVVFSASALVFNTVLASAQRARQSIEEQVALRTEELYDARMRAEAADKNKTNLIFFLCHELR